MVSIIVLIILAGVSIAMLVGENGIITQAQRAAQETEQAQIEEQRKLAMLEASVHLEEYEYTDANGEKVNIPAQCAVSKVEGENTLENGLVIIDINGNEWVWIEVPKSEMPDGLRFENETDYTTLETALQTYVNIYRGASVDEWYSEEQHGFASAEEYNNLKQKMLESIYINGGFYIGRYEVGSFDSPVTSEDTTRTAVIQKGAYPYNYVTCKQAEELSEGLAIGEKISSLMFGIQWDLALKYLEINADWDTSNEASYYLKSNSSAWGNYRDIEFTVEQDNKYAIYSNSSLGEWANVPVNYIKPIYDSNENGVLLSTGATDRNSKMNIYDLAGNVFEWTLERSSTNADYPCVGRGGYYCNTGSIAPASNRYRYSTSYNTNDFGFRTALY